VTKVALGGSAIRRTVTRVMPLERLAAGRRPHMTMRMPTLLPQGEAIDTRTRLIRRGRGHGTPEGRFVVRWGDPSRARVAASTSATYVPQLVGLRINRRLRGSWLKASGRRLTCAPSGIIRRPARTSVALHALEGALHLLDDLINGEARRPLARWIFLEGREELGH